MTAIEIIVIVICALIVISVIVKGVVDKKNGKCACGECDNCPNSRKCKKPEKIDNKDFNDIMIDDRTLKGEEEMSKYLICKSCGAIVKVIKPCECPNCGIRCCGKEMEEYILNEELKGTGKILTCSSCGAKVEVIKACECPNCGIQCCGKEME